MTVFTKQRRFFSILASIIALSLVLSACGSANGTGAGSSSTPAAGGGASANGKGCTKVGVLLPETASSARWDSKDRPLLDAAIQAVQGIYMRNIFPEMDITWGTYPDNLGHVNSPGCFRCHDGNHASADGKTIPNDCDTCHDVLAMQESNPKILQELGMKQP